MDAGDSIMFGPVSQNADVRGELCPRCRTEMRRHVTGPIASYCPSCDVSRPVSADPTPPAAPRHCGCGHETPRATDRCTHFDKRGGRCTEPADHGGYHWYAWLDPDRLAVAPSRDSGALLDEYAEASRLRGEFRAVGADGFAAEHATLADAARKELDARLSTLERDAARMDRLETMRGKLGRSGYIVIHTMQNETVREHIDTLADRVAALAPSVESR